MRVCHSAGLGQEGVGVAKGQKGTDKWKYRGRLQFNITKNFLIVGGSQKWHGLH